MSRIEALAEKNAVYELYGGNDFFDLGRLIWGRKFDRAYVKEQLKRKQ